MQKMEIQENKQILSSYGVKLLPNEKRCKRVKVFTGPLCNHGCVFCYYKNRLHEKFSFDMIKERIDIAYEYGCRDVDLSGGEASIRKDFFEILDYCTSKGMKVSTVSNGWKFADFEFIKEAHKHGLNEILFSLHGSNPDLHDSIVKHKGAFNRLIQAIKNSQKLGVLIRINCTVFSQNAKSLENEYPELLLKLKPYEVNFIEVNYWSDNVGFNISNTEETVYYLKKCIDKIKNSILINVRYIPFCYMKGYEKYNTNYFQIVYDIYDWEIFGYTYLSENPNNPLNQAKIKLDNLSEEDKLKLNYKACRENRIHGFNKYDACMKCKYFYICDGIKKALDSVIEPKPDVVEDIKEQIKDPLYYRHNFFD